MKKLILFAFASILCACSGSSYKYVDINEIAALGIIDDYDKQGEIVYEKSFDWGGDFVGEIINSKMKSNLIKKIMNRKQIRPQVYLESSFYHNNIKNKKSLKKSTSKKSSSKKKTLSNKSS